MTIAGLSKSLRLLVVFAWTQASMPGWATSCWQNADWDNAERQIWLLASAANTGELTQTERDAREFVTALERFAHVPKVQQCVLADVTAGQLRAAFHELRKVGKEDLVVFYFSGHGSKRLDDDGDERQYPGMDRWEEVFVTTSSKGGDALPGFVRDDEYASWVQAIPTMEYLAVLDACYAADLVRARPDSSLRSKFLVSRLMSLASRPVPAAQGSLDMPTKGLVLSATSGKSLAFESDERGGLFSSVLNRSLSRQGSRRLEFTTLFDHWAQEVRTLSGNKQLPEYTGDEDIWQRWFVNSSFR